jgi:hemerythrin-like domain-containing protein
MADPLNEWHNEHVRFGRLLDLLDAQLAVFRAGEEPTYELMRDIVHYLRDFAGRFHHPREDAAFERLTRREPAMQTVVGRLLQEHRVIARAGEELLNRLNDIAEDVFVERAALEAAAGTYLVYYRHHLATEEADILPCAAQLLTPEDWAAVAAAVPAAGSDPLFGPDVDARHEELRRQVSPDGPAS